MRAVVTQEGERSESDVTREIDVTYREEWPRDLYRFCAYCGRQDDTTPDLLGDPICEDCRGPEEDADVIELDPTRRKPKWMRVLRKARRR